MIFAVAAIGCRQSQESASDKSSVSLAKPTNGIYLVERWTVEKDDLFPLFENETFYEYDESKFFELADEEKQPLKYVALSQTEFIPFELEKRPQAIAKDDGRFDVGLTFSKPMSDRMAAFSRKYLGRQVATVIDGEVLTLHKIRSIIDGGKLQITRCTDRGCELILSRLSK